MVAGMTLILKGHNDPSKLDLNRNEKVLISEIFDSLIITFIDAPDSTALSIASEDVFENLLIIFSLDKAEQELYAKADKTDFIHAQIGASQAHYKEPAYAFASNIIKQSKVALPFLSLCVKTLKINKATKPERAASALFILALCEDRDLEDHVEHVRAFIESEVFPLVKDSSANELLRFRALWILESFANSLTEEK